VPNKIALDCLKRLEQKMDEYQPGYANSEATQTFKDILKELSDSADAPSNLVDEKLGSIIELLGVLYSEGKHRRRGGVENVKSQILMDVASLKMILERGRTSS
jgi:hypothetical protein